MNVYRKVAEWRRARDRLETSSLGFVPTMGALHRGHVALLRRSVTENDHTVVSIFVNPTQFDEPDDLAAYPRQMERDLELLGSVGVDSVLMPDSDEIYPDGYRYRIAENDLSHRLCGAHRDGHFEGVLTVVMRLLNIVRPDRAYFGEKDFQQLRLIEGMVDAFFMPVTIVACPTVRERDGLAISSRNQRLSGPQRERAPLLHRVLKRAASSDDARNELEASGFVVDYVTEYEGRRLVAARLGDTRLIDNVVMDGNR